jgi:high-affinity K+ transport system ATPase subunit B
MPAMPIADRSDVEIGKQLLITRGALTTFSIAKCRRSFSMR